MALSTQHHPETPQPIGALIITNTILGGVLINYNHKKYIPQNPVLTITAP